MRYPFEYVSKNCNVFLDFDIIIVYHAGIRNSTRADCPRRTDASGALWGEPGRRVRYTIARAHARDFRVPCTTLCRPSDAPLNRRRRVRIALKTGPPFWHPPRAERSECVLWP